MTERAPFRYYAPDTFPPDTEMCLLGVHFGDRCDCSGQNVWLFKDDDTKRAEVEKLCGWIE